MRLTLSSLALPAVCPFSSSLFAGPVGGALSKLGGENLLRPNTNARLRLFDGRVRFVPSVRLRHAARDDAFEFNDYYYTASQAARAGTILRSLLFSNRGLDLVSFVLEIEA